MDNARIRCPMICVKDPSRDGEKAVIGCEDGCKIKRCRYGDGGSLSGYMCVPGGRPRDELPSDSEVESHEIEMDD